MSSKQELRAWIIAELVSRNIVNINFGNPQRNKEWASPFFFNASRICENAALRKAVRDLFVSTIQENNLSPECIVGVPTGGIPQATLIADTLNLPSGYLKYSKKPGNSPKTKTKGCGDIFKKRILIIEDILMQGSYLMQDCLFLQTSGVSSLTAMVLFNQDICDVHNDFSKAGVGLIELFKPQDFYAELEKTFSGEKLQLFQNWKADPMTWSKENKKEFSNA